MKGNFHVRCGTGENLEIISKDYLSWWINSETRESGGCAFAYKVCVLSLGTRQTCKCVGKLAHRGLQKSFVVPIKKLNCWEALKLTKLQRKDEKSLSVNVAKAEKIS